jgi:two-component system, chemotaxis family, chemotaxis protein CheY
MKILVIDDSGTMRMMLIKMLRELGYSECIAVSTAEEAIPVAFNNAVDIILSDWNLPKMSGLDLLKYLRSTPETKKIPVIMISSMHDRSAILRALKAGLQGYILKPVKKEILGPKLKEIEKSEQ